jgi:hypothetical protein
MVDLTLVLLFYILLIAVGLGILMVCLSLGHHQNDLEEKIDLILKKLSTTPDEETSEVR